MLNLSYLMEASIQINEQILYNHITIYKKDIIMQQPGYKKKCHGDSDTSLDIHALYLYNPFNTGKQYNCL